MRIALHDELASGIAVVAAPEVEQAHALGHAGYALWVFALPLLVAALIEAPIALLSDRCDRAKLLHASLWCWSASLLMVAAAGEPWLLSLGLACSGAASGVACTCAQAALVSAPGGSSARAMARWTAFAAAGDLLAPAFVAAALWACGSYRGGALAAACLLAAEAWCSARVAPQPGHATPLAAGSLAGEEEPRESFLRVFTRPRLWGLLVAASLCGLLDEVVVALCALHLSRAFVLSEALEAASLSLFSLGSLLGAGMVERLTGRFSSRAILSVSAAGALLFLAGLARARSPIEVDVALFCLGVAAAAHYPLLQAAAYDSAKGRPGLVNAGTQLLVALDIALPLLVGLVAERAGLPLALLSLAVQPLGVALAALVLLRDERRPI